MATRRALSILTVAPLTSDKRSRISLWHATNDRETPPEGTRTHVEAHIVDVEYSRFAERSLCLCAEGVVLARCLVANRSLP